MTIRRAINALPPPRAPPTLWEHRTHSSAPSNYPKQPLRLRTPSSSEDDGDLPPPRLAQGLPPPTRITRGNIRPRSADQHRYPKRQLRGRLLAILRSGHAFSILAMIALVCLLSVLPPVWRRSPPQQLWNRRDLLPADGLLLLRPHGSTGRTVASQPGDAVSVLLLSDGKGLQDSNSYRRKRKGI